MNDFIITKYYTEPTEKYNLISTVIFKLKNSYKSFNHYLNGLEFMIDNFQTHFPGFYLRLYYDDSIVDPIISESSEITDRFTEIITKHNNNKCLQLAHYKHPQFLNNSRHIGLFGTIVRLLPFFNSDNTNIVLSAEIDIRDTFFTLYKNMYTDFNLANAKILFMTRQCYHLRPRYADVTKHLNVKFMPYIGTMWIRGKLPEFLLNDFLNCIYNSDNINLDAEPCTYLSIFVKNIEKNTSRGTIDQSKPLIEKLLHFGIDEIFAANIIAYLMKNNIPYMIDLLPSLTFVLDDTYGETDEIINQQVHIDLIRRIMQNHYDNNKTVRENYNIMKRSLLFNYTFKPKNKFDKFIIRNTMRELMMLLKNDQYKKLGFDSDNFQCIRHSYDIFRVVVLLCDNNKCETIKKY